MRIKAFLSTIVAVNCLAYSAANGQNILRPRFLNPYPGSDGAIVSDIRVPPPREAYRSFPVIPPEVAENRPYVRAGYVIPSNRSAQPRGVETIQYVITTYQNWLRDQMRHHKQGPKTFVHETEPDGVTPKVNLIHVAEADSYIREDVWGRTLSAVSNAGVAMWQPGEVWLLFVEAHVQSPDGDVTGGTALGASWGSGDDPGVAMLGSDGLAMLRPEFSTNDLRYDNAVVPEIGPYPLKQDVSFSWFEGDTFSSVHSSALGAGMHELGHAFGLPHDFRNDQNFHGNLMGNGLRGFRGCLYPARYTNDFSRLSYVAALALGRSRYLNAGRTDAARPTLSVSTQATVTLVGGLLPIQFSASDDRAMASAFLTWEGDVVAETMLKGAEVSGQFTTEHFELGVSKTYAVFVYDLEGNRASQEVTITAVTKSNSAPRPFVKVTPPLMFRGESFTLDASDSTDPDQSVASLLVEWDLDGDGLFDTAPSTTKTLVITADTPGARAIRARITDEFGAATISTAILVDPHLPLLTITGDGGPPTMEWESALGFTYQVEQSRTLLSWSGKGFPLFHGDGLMQEYQLFFSDAQAQFSRLWLGKRQN